jgi:hypothetical protein
VSLPPHPIPLPARGEEGDFPHPRRRGGFETRSYETGFCGMRNEVVERRI